MKVAVAVLGTLPIAACSVFLPDGDGPSDDVDGGEGCTEPTLTLNPIAEGEGADLSSRGVANPADWSLPRLIGLEGCDELGDDVTLDLPAGVELVDTAVAGRFAAFTVRVPLDDGRDGTEFLEVTARGSDGGAIASGELEVVFLPEGDSLASGDYSIVRIDDDGGADGSIEIRSRSAIVLGADLELAASSQTGGPGGADGGVSGMSALGPGAGAGGSSGLGTCAGSGGGNGSVGGDGINTGVGGSIIGDALFTGADQPFGGGGGGACGGLVGGGGGGYIELTARGSVVLLQSRSIDVSGASGDNDGTANAGGGGAGGSVMLRARRITGAALTIAARGGPGVSAGGGLSGPGGQGRARIDLATAASLDTPAFCNGSAADVCVEGAALFTGVALRTVAGQISDQPVGLVASAPTLGHATPLAIDDTSASFRIDANDTFFIDRPGVHRVCALNVPAEGDDPDLSRRALVDSCVDVAYLPID